MKVKIPRTNKYHAQKTVVDGIPFDSKAEARRYGELKWMEKGGEIVGLKVHPTFLITIKGKFICHVELDFQYLAGDGEFYEDVKGFDNPLSKLKRKLVEATYGIRIEVIIG